MKNGEKGLSQKQVRNALLRLGIKPASFDIEKFWFDLDKQGMSISYTLKVVLINLFCQNLDVATANI